MMKRKTTTILIVLMLILLVTGCTKTNTGNFKVKKVDLSTYVETLSLDFSYGCSTSRFLDYMTNWAEQAKTDVKTDEHGNMIFSIAATEGYEKIKQTVICCNYNPSFFSSDITTIAMCQYLIENSENHGAYKVIFTNNALNEHQGALNLSDVYFDKGANVISLDYSYKTHASLNTGNQFSSALKVDIAKTDDNIFNSAYKIRITDIKEAVLDEQVKQQPNPIKILGELMAYFKMKSMAYQLADLSYETAGGDFPLGAEFTILINDYNKTNFTDYMDGKIESFNKKYEEDFEGISYTYEEVELPSLMYSRESTENIVSLLYTITDGNSLDSNDDVYAISTLNGFEVKDDSFTLNLISNTRSKESMSNLTEEIKTVTSFVNAKLKTKESLDHFRGIKDSKLLNRLNHSDIKYSKDELETYDSVRFTSCTYLKSKNTNLDIVHIFVNPEDNEDITGCIATYLSDSNLKFTEDGKIIE
ncbi:MAG: aminoacyl-histidine dipeptidase [Clostridiales bacterium]|nr:aminoacyl-histidine dipeptidase [Clostridiales bacterium]